jgi:hypothetical protein
MAVAFVFVGGFDDVIVEDVAEARIDGGGAVRLVWVQTKGEGIDRPER